MSSVPAATDTPLTTGQVADRLRVQAWRIKRLYRRGVLPEPPRLGRARMIMETDIPAIVAALRDAGCLPREDAADA